MQKIIFAMRLSSRLNTNWKETFLNMRGSNPINTNLKGIILAMRRSNRLNTNWMGAVESLEYKLDGDLLDYEEVE